MAGGMYDGEVAKKPSELSVGALKETLTAVAIDFSHIFDKADLIQLLEIHLATLQDDTIQRCILPMIWRCGVQPFSSSSVVGKGAGLGAVKLLLKPDGEDSSSSKNLGTQYKERSSEPGFRV